MINTTDEIKILKEYATDNNVPIMQDEGINFLIDFINKKNINSILEVGTAIGYSAIMMAISNPNLKITSIERDYDRYLQAVKNIKKFNLENRITLIYDDALQATVENNFDLVFIDAAKGQNINFFNKFEKNLNTSGYIITDNMNFHGLVDKPKTEIKSRNLRQLVGKIKKYREFLQEKTDYEIGFLNIGDGIAVAHKIETK